MKKPLPVTLAILAAGLIVLLGASAYGQAVNIKLEAMSPGRRVGVTGPNYVSTGLRVFAKGMKMYMSADTTGSGASAVTSYDWTFLSKPAGSAAVMDSAAKKMNSFTGDLPGEYVVVCAVNGGAKMDTMSVFASTYVGWPTQPLGCQTCHAANSASYATTAHATIFTRGITGQLEVDSTGRGAYAKSCVRCHTTGWESVTDNGNFGYIANQTKWDSTWWKNLPIAAGDYWIPWKDQTLLNDLKATYPTLAPVATIGCESCHGPGKDHFTPAPDKNKIANSFEAGICLQCHDAPNKHRIGKDWKTSAHATMPLSGEEASRTGCWPCHNGPAIAAVQKNPTAPDYTKTPVVESIACQDCHDPHGNGNERMVRIVQAQPLMNGYAIPAGVGGMGNLCMTCHRSRYDANAKVAAQQRVFSQRFYAHYSPQADMYLGTNAFEFGQNLSGLMTHEGAENACVTCHMAPLSGGLSNHGFNMVDAAGKDIVTACKECHGEISDFAEIRAMGDYDGNGTIEAATVEVAGLMAQLKATLPLGADGEPVTGGADSVKVKAHPKYPTVLGAMWNYYFVKQDFSGGIHNTKYAVAILKLSMAKMLTSVEPLNQETPNSFGLGQNYPNPFNPTTSFQFSIPRGGDVKLHIFDASGRLMTTLANGRMVPGNYNAHWDGRDGNGQTAPSGVYFYRLEVTNNSQALFTSTRKMVMLK